jgi:hypothetical protein
VTGPNPEGRAEMAWKARQVAKQLDELAYMMADQNWDTSADRCRALARHLCREAERAEVMVPLA